MVGGHTMLEYLKTYTNSLYYGYLGSIQYTYLFVLSVNPFLFEFMNLRHYIIFLIGMGLSLFNYRVIHLAVLLIILSINNIPESVEWKKKILYPVLITASILFLFGK